MSSIREMKAVIRQWFADGQANPFTVATYQRILAEKGITYLVRNGKVIFQSEHKKIPIYTHGEKIGIIQDAQVRCPFCDFPSSRSNPFKWCSGCYTEYYEDEDGQYIFDPQLHREKYRLAIALAKAGGARIGGYHSRHQEEDEQ